MPINGGAPEMTGGERPDNLGSGSQVRSSLCVTGTGKREMPWSKQCAGSGRVFDQTPSIDGDLL